MLRRDFIELPEWQKIARTLIKQIDVCIEHAMASESLAEIRYNAGFRDALRTVLELPNELLSDGEPPHKAEPEGVVEMANHPRSSVRSAF